MIINSQIKQKFIRILSVNSADMGNLIIALHRESTQTVLSAYLIIYVVIQKFKQIANFIKQLHNSQNILKSL